eukprot:scaffold57515_cov41-Phaeocystis_antarctica.AAC.2
MPRSSAESTSPARPSSKSPASKSAPPPPPPSPPGSTAAIPTRLGSIPSPIPPPMPPSSWPSSGVAESSSIEEQHSARTHATRAERSRALNGSDLR